MNDLVSVCMPTFNRAEYLAEAIDSWLKQTYKNFELIVVSDGCTDSTPELMEYFTKKDPRVKYHYRKENKGIAYTRNEAINYTKGNFIAVADSDDLVLPKKLSKSLKRLKDTGADFVYGSYFKMDVDGRSSGIQMPPHKVTIEQIIDNAAFPHTSIVAKKKCFIDNPYREHLIYNDDSFLILDFYKAKYKWSRINEPLTMVRYHNTRISVGKEKEIRRINEELEKEARASGLK